MKKNVNKIISALLVLLGIALILVAISFSMSPETLTPGGILILLGVKFSAVIDVVSKVKDSLEFFLGKKQETNSRTHNHSEVTQQGNTNVNATNIDHLEIHNPPVSQPKSKKITDDQKIRRKHDLDVLQKVFENINTNALDIYYFEEAKRGNNRRHEMIIFFAENLENIARPVVFHIYDKKLSKKFWAFYNTWMISIAQFNKYAQMTESPFWFFFQVDDMDMERGEAFEEYLKQVYQTEIACKDLIRYVKENYMEIDFDQTNLISKKLWEKEFEEMKRNIEQDLEKYGKQWPKNK